MTPDQLIQELHTELLSLYTTFKPKIKDGSYDEWHMRELINRVGGACGKIVDYQREQAR
jgi:ABC-type transport system involved in cytochrome c biogenesis permease component